MPLEESGKAINWQLQTRINALKLKTILIRSSNLAQLVTYVYTSALPYETKVPRLVWKDRLSGAYIVHSGSIKSPTVVMGYLTQKHIYCSVLLFYSFDLPFLLE